MKNLKAFFDYSRKIDDVYENLKSYNSTKERRVFIVFDDMITDMQLIKKLSPAVTLLVLKGKNSILYLLLSHNLILKCLKL